MSWHHAFQVLSNRLEHGDLRAMLAVAPSYRSTAMPEMPWNAPLHSHELIAVAVVVGRCSEKLTTCAGA